MFPKKSIFFVKLGIRGGVRIAEDPLFGNFPVSFAESISKVNWRFPLQDWEEHHAICAGSPDKRRKKVREIAMFSGYAP